MSHASFGSRQISRNMSPDGAGDDSVKITRNTSNVSCHMHLSHVQITFSGGATQIYHVNSLHSPRFVTYFSSSLAFLQPDHATTVLLGPQIDSEAVHPAGCKKHGMGGQGGSDRAWDGKG